jgi:hypothetical protein
MEFTHEHKLIGVICFITLCSSAKRKRRGPDGFNKVCAISPELQAVVGETAMSRTQVNLVSFTSLDQQITSDFFPFTNFSNHSLLNI